MVTLPPLLDRNFPPCTVEGSSVPEIVGHLTERFLAPHKCLQCDLFHEGDCLRANARASVGSEPQHRVMDLDFGPCPVPNIPDVKPYIAIRCQVKKEVLVPGKCCSCNFLTREAKCGRYENAMGLPCTVDFSGIPQTTVQTG